MGNKTGNVSSTDFNPFEWQLTDKENTQSENKGNFKVLQNVKTGELIDEYQLYWPSEEDFRFYLDSYYWRRQQYNIVPSRYIVEQHSDQFCSRSYGAKVYIEHIQTRLSDVTDIPYPDNLYVALAVLEGYQKLYENVHHYFPISEDQICVDKEGVVKVWVNSDLSKNYPEPQGATTQNKDQANMVDDLLNIVWENTDEESEPQSFRQFFAKKKGKKRIGFDQAKVIVNEYAKNVSCQIPQKFNSILQMIEQSDYQDNQEVQENEQELHNVEDEQNYDEHGRYMYENEQGYGQHEYDSEQMHNQQRQYFPGQQFYHQQQQQYIPESQAIIHEQPLYYPIPHPHQIQRQMPMAHAVNPIMPIQYSAHRGPIISIPPPVRGNVRVMGPVVNQQLQTFNPFNPVVNHQQQQQLYINQYLQQQQYVPPHQRLSDNLQHQQQFLERYSEHNQQQLLNTEAFANTHHQFEQHISTLNPQSGTSSQQDQTNQQALQPQQYPSRHELNNSVGRSLQLINQSSKKTQQQVQKTRVNKSHINELGEVVQVNYPRQYEEQAFNSRISGMGNSRMGESGNRVQELRYIREEMLDTKYYTLDEEVQLDQEIAADLKKMIMAL